MTDPQTTMDGSISKTRCLQLNRNNELCHLLDLAGLEKAHLTQIMDLAATFFQKDNNQTKKIRKVPMLRGRTVVNMFYENSTRTRVTFQMGADKLSADFIDWQMNASSVAKGESLYDTVRNLEAMHAEVLILRHPWSGSAHFAASHCKPVTTIINAGDGSHAHPTQALLDLYTIGQHHSDFEQLSVAIVGDVHHSRVSRSLCHGLAIMGCRDIRLVSPPQLAINFGSVATQSFTNIDQAIEGCQVVVVLRLQFERMRDGIIFNPEEYARDYGLNKRRLALLDPEAIIMHPGPINRGVEITPEVADSGRSVILQQVHNGIAIRMAVMVTTIANQPDYHS